MNAVDFLFLAPERAGPFTELVPELLFWSSLDEAGSSRTSNFVFFTTVPSDPAESGLDAVTRALRLVNADREYAMNGRGPDEDIRQFFFCSRGAETP